MSENVGRVGAELALRKALHELADASGYELTERESVILADGIVDLLVERGAFRAGRRRNGHATLQLNLRDAEVRGHETASRRVG